MDDYYRKLIHGSMNQKTTEELVQIWQTNDRVQWNDDVFKILQQILQQRLAELPVQNPPIYDYKDQEISVDDDRLPLLENNENEPVFYQTRDVFWIQKWLQRLSIISVIVILLSNAPSIYDVTLSYFFYGQINAESVFSGVFFLGISVLSMIFYALLNYFGLKAFSVLLGILREMEVKIRE